MIDSQIEDFLKDEFSKNRGHYKLLIAPAQKIRDACIDAEDPVFYHDILVEYEMVMKTMIFQDLADNFRELDVQEMYIVIDDLDLVSFFEPEN